MSGVRPPLNRSTMTGQCHARPFYRPERAAVIYRAGVWVVSGAGMDIWVKTYIFLPLPGMELILLGPPVYDLVTMPTELQLC